jgi:AcrR family transcriptional regulator
MQAVTDASSRTPYPVAARELLRSTLLDAALDQMSQRTWADVPMAAIAAAAGVSRQTLYNEFGSRDALAQALILREAERFAGAIEGVLDAHRDDPRAALTAAVDLFLTTAADNPIVRAVALGGADDLLPLVTTHGRPVLEQATEQLTAVIRARWPQAGPHDCEILAECLVRLAISHAALPSGTPRETAAALEALLGPFIDHALEP